MHVEKARILVRVSIFEECTRCYWDSLVFYPNPLLAWILHRHLVPGRFYFPCEAVGCLQGKRSYFILQKNSFYGGIQKKNMEGTRAFSYPNGRYRMRALTLHGNTSLVGIALIDHYFCSRSKA
jgi:hypothetical protein